MPKEKIVYFYIVNIIVMIYNYGHKNEVSKGLCG